MTTQERQREAEAAGWTDVRLVRQFGRGLVLRGLRHFLNAGIPVATYEDVPMTLEEFQTPVKPPPYPR
jgi:hypothetical protein